MASAPPPTSLAALSRAGTARAHASDAGGGLVRAADEWWRRGGAFRHRLTESSHIRNECLPAASQARARSLRKRPNTPHRRRGACTPCLDARRHPLRAPSPPPSPTLSSPGVARWQRLGLRFLPGRAAAGLALTEDGRTVTRFGPADDVAWRGALSELVAETAGRTYAEWVVEEAGACCHIMLGVADLDAPPEDEGVCRRPTARMCASAPPLHHP